MGMTVPLGTIWSSEGVQAVVSRCYFCTNLYGTVRQKPFAELQRLDTRTIVGYPDPTDPLLNGLLDPDP
jgi:hypothetical protein